MVTLKVLIVILLFLECFESLQEIYPYMTPVNCTKNQYFDGELLKCISCDNGFVKDDYGTSCGCYGLNKYVKASKNSSKLECLQCKANEYVSNDKTSCVSRNCFNIGNGKITCAVCKKDEIIVTNSVNGSLLPVVECVTCSPGYLPSSDRTRCELCPYRSNQNLCFCDRFKSTVFDNFCIPNTYAKNLTMLQVKNRIGDSVQSDFIDKHWVVSNYLCYNKNSTACQMVANMCVLSLYHKDNNDVCKLGKNVKNNDLPELLYGEDESYSVLFRKKIPLMYSLNTENENNLIDIKALSYDIYGKIKSFPSRTSEMFYPCPAVWKAAEKNMLKFAENYGHKCSIGIQQLISESDTLFYEPFLKYIDKENKDVMDQLYAIPVLIRGNLVFFNKENDINSWQFVRRFYVLDKLTGFSNTEKVLKFVRYASRIEIRIRVRQKGSGERNKIYPPLIVIDYAEADEKDIKSNAKVDVEFLVNFKLDGSGLITGMEISVGSLSAFGVLYSILQSWSHARRSGKLGFDPYTLLQFFIFSSANLSNIFFIVSFGASLYSFLIYKTQKVVYMMSPTERDEYMIQTYMIVAFSLKIVEVLALNWRQINIDISFIDWDKPILTSEHNIRRANIKQDSQVSFWRPYFVANEWNEIQTLRKISLPLHLVCCIFVIEIFGASSWAHTGVQINTEHSTNYLTSPTYQYALSGLIFLLLYFIQLALSIFVYERFIKNALLDFMDVCSIANVSLLILQEPLYGYYLHGRSAHASCNSDVRGLQPGLPYRAFSVRCTTDFRLYYSRLSIHMLSKNVKWQWQHHLSNGPDSNVKSEQVTESSRKHSGKSSKKSSGDGDISIAPSLPPALEHREQASKLINKFLTAFFDHALEDLDYEVREKRFVERLLDIEMINEGNHKTVLLYNAAGDSQSFQRSIWYGQEWTLITFDLYLFCAVQILTGNYVLAALICGIIWKFLSIFRQYFGQKNLAKKTLIDERFLI